jgi:CBS domain-containing protein
MATVQDTTPLVEAFRRMINKKILAIPVVDAKGGVVSILTTLDVIAVLVKHITVQEVQKFDFNWMEHKAELKDLTAGTVRTTKIEAVEVINESQSILDAAKLMKSSHAHRVLVLDDQLRPTNIITQSRILKLAAAMLDGIPNANKTLSELKLDSKALVTDDEDTPCLDAFKKMVHNNVSAIAITNKKGQLIGTISETDIRQIGYDFKFFFYLSFSCKEFLNHIRIYDATRTIPDSEDPVCVKSTATLADVLKKVNFYNIHRVFVVDADRKPTGVVSLSDITAAIL